jgi:antitoxin (DNA-binding transcriptional repressor) of toxin-antitoxin stability system
MKTAGIRELKDRLSAYLREVEHGETVLVTDRGRVIAELRPPGAEDRAASPEDLRYRRLVERGFIRPGRGKTFRFSDLPACPLSSGTSQDLLDAEREE